MKATTIIVTVLLVIIVVVPCHSIDRWTDEYLRVPSEYPTIQAAIAAAMDGDIVLVSSGTYTGEGNLEIDFLGKAITVKSAYGPEYTVIDCENSGRGFYFCNGEDHDSVIEGFTIQMGIAEGSYPDYYGGGIYCTNSSSPTITNNILISNTAERGGGLACIDASPVITGCTFSGNIASSGSGIYGRYNSFPIIMDCTITENNVGSGISFVWNASPVLINCIISDNWNSGGGLDFYISNPNISHCTISGNHADRQGGGIVLSRSNITLSNCIIWDNYPEEIDTFSTSCDITYSVIKNGWEGIGNIDTDPHFIDPVIGDFHLRPDSPCIDSGTDLGIIRDFEGDIRPMNGWFDIGADEIYIDGIMIHATPRYFQIEGTLGEQVKAESLSVVSVGTEKVDYSIAPDCGPWISAFGELQGTLAPWDSALVTLEIDISELKVGIYYDTISIISNDPYRPELKIPVKLELSSSGIIKVPQNFGTIQDAIDHALDGATIILADGTYTGDGNKDIQFSGKEITVTSTDGPEHTIIDCENDGRGFHFTDNETNSSILEGLSIFNGYVNANYGGGILCRDSSPVILNCIISQNKIDGGIYCAYSEPIISECIIYGNSNKVRGGGLEIFASHLMIDNCIIYENTATEDGGGIYATSSTVLMENNTLFGNSAEHGCGIYSRFSVFIITNNIIWGNVSTLIIPSCSDFYVSFSDIEGGWEGHGNLDLDPMFLNPDIGDFSLLHSSPCIDAGDPSFTNIPWGGARRDMGACEYDKGWYLDNDGRIIHKPITSYSDLHPNYTQSQ